nr:T9SS type A sorting domain-containing protein [Candidatus Neomarinimicrobiota bacterium]
MRSIIIVISIFLTTVRLFAVDVELVEKRSIYTKTYCTNSDSSFYKTVYSSIPVHYIDTSDKYTDIPSSGSTRDSLLTLASTQCNTRSCEDYVDWDCVGSLVVVWDNMQPTPDHYEQDTDTSVGCNVTHNDEDKAIHRSYFGLSGMTIPYDYNDVTFDNLDLDIEWDDTYVEDQYSDLRVEYLGPTNFTNCSAIGANENDYDELDSGTFLSPSFGDYNDDFFSFSQFESGDGFFDDFVDIVSGGTDFLGLAIRRNQDDYSDFDIDENDFALITLIRLTLCYTINPDEYDVTVTNEYNSTDIGGYFREKMSSDSEWSGNLDSGESVTVIEETDWDFRTVRAEIEYSSVDRKFQTWDGVLADSRLILPDETYTSSTSIDAEFQNTTTVTITVPSGVASVYIKDPWWVIHGTYEDSNESVRSWHQINNTVVTYDVFEDIIDAAYKYEIKVYDFYVNGTTAYFFDEWESTDATVNDPDSNEIIVIFTDVTPELEALYTTVSDDPSGASSAPTNLAVTSSGGNPYLTWTHVADDDRSHYNVWAKYTTFGEAGFWLKVGTSENNYWTDTNVGTGGPVPDRAYYKINVEDYFSNVSSYSSEVNIRGDVINWPLERNSSGDEFVITEYKLHVPYPNPFNPVVSLPFDIKSDCRVNLSVYDINGKQIVTLVNQNLQSGNYSYTWDATKYPSGAYFIKLITPDYSENQ